MDDEETWTEEDEQLLQEHWAQLMADNETPPVHAVEIILDPAVPPGTVWIVKGRSFGSQRYCRECGVVGRCPHTA